MIAAILRPYQTQALDLARGAFRKHRRVLLVAPTGAGKTVIFSAVVTGAISKGKRVVVIVHRRELVRQTLAKMLAAGIARVGVIAAGYASDPDAPVQVASIQTLLARDALPEADLVILDEAHHFVAAEWGAVASHYTRARILGVTATPERGDGRPLGDLFDVLVPIVSMSDLIEQRFLVQPKVIAPRRYTKLSDLSAEAVFESVREHGADRGRIVIFARSIEHASGIAEHFRANGIAAKTVSAETPADERDATLAAFADGSIRVVCNVFCLTEGWDCPPCDCAVLARGFSFPGSYLQAVGRVLRPAEGKRDALVIDLRGVVHLHGLPEADRVFSLDGKAISGGDAPVKTCPRCEAEVAIASMTCPFCGFEFPVIEAPTVRVKLSRIDQLTLEREFFLESIEESELRGYRNGWVAHRFVDKFGRFPASLWREFFPKRAVAA